MKIRTILHLNTRPRLFVALAYFIGNHLVINHFPYFIKNMYLRHVLKIRIGDQTSIARDVFITGNRITIGENTVINRRVYLDGRAPLTIGNNVNISHSTIIQSLTHDYQNPFFIALERPVSISDDVWIGAAAIICPGVTVGRGAVIGAGAVVSRDVEAFSVVVGNPARKIKTRNPNILYKSAYFPYFDTDIQR